MGDDLQTGKNWVETISNYIDYYNKRRLQRKLHVMTPLEFHELCIAGSA